MTSLMLAKAAGAIAIITSSSDDKLKLAKEKYGADHLTNYKKTPGWADEANKITNGRSADFIIENGGSGTIAQSIKCCARGGQVAVIGFLSQAKEMPDVASLVLEKGSIVRGINVGDKQLTEDLVRFVCSHDLQMLVEKVFKFTREDVVRAYEYIESGSHVGKICIQVA